MESNQKLIDSLLFKICKQLKSHDKQLNENFIKLKTNFDRFKFIWHLSFIGKELDNLFKTHRYNPKEAEKSSLYRKEGNEQFKIKRFYDAILKYNLSLKYASHQKSENTDENDLALSYANRSAVFYHLNEFHLCLNDIESALKFGYPEKSISKLIERKLNALIKLECFFSALECLKSNKANLSHESFKLFESKLKVDTLSDKNIQDPYEEFYFKNYGNINFELKKPNSKIPNADSSLVINYTQEKGYFLKAGKNIKVGELLVNEPPFASVLLGHKLDTNCFECMLKLNPLKMNITFCSQCSEVVYCSEKCADISWKTNHKFECKYFKLLLNESGLTHMEWLSLRIVLKAGKGYLLSIKPLLEEYEKRYEVIKRDSSSLLILDEEDTQVYKSDSYLAIFNLITNSSVRKLSDLFRRTFVSLFLVKLLEKSDFFQGDNSQDFKENQWFIGGLILRHLQAISCNAHEVSELKLSDAKKNAMASSSAEAIGAGIYAILSLFNHSCDPHVTRNFRGSKCQVRALQNIKKGEEIYDNYGVLYAVNDIKERHEKLKDQYFFDCKCSPCLNNWPLYDKIESDLEKNKILCNDCKSWLVKDCNLCLAELDNMKLHQLNAQTALNSFLNINSDFSQGDKVVVTTVENIFGYFCKYLELLYSHDVKRPFQEFNNYEEAIKQLLNLVNIK
ncbi:unnamed protein product [Brachionus calyciflorus]|uniref:Protein-lysine N-methyltransferase SMYD4 n=1 Tax=Brachionus calyciflorus TaxID=104777 RepID=A0A813MD16_9BILA|nr:unnamed protein product [Brachionus calyciflorus]